MRTRSVRAALERHRELNLAPPVRLQDLPPRFHPTPPESLQALLITMGPFVTSTDAFRFNNQFPITDAQAQQIRERYRPIVDVAVGAAVQLFRGVLDGISLNPTPLGPSVTLPGVVADAVIGEVTQRLAGDLLDRIGGAIPGTFGRCGGMAFAGYDFYRLGWPVDERLGTSPPATGPLGDYLFSRLLDSLDLNALTFVDWVLELHVLPVASRVATTALLAEAGSLGGPLGMAVGAFVGSQTDVFQLGGLKPILDRTIDQWSGIKGRLDEQAAWPIRLIYGDDASPVAQHQVLAIGYADAGGGRGTLTVWDNNDANYPRGLGLDLSGDELQVTNSDRPLKGFFLEEYAPQQPPEELRLA
jgi:hypothetical protein